MVTIFIATENRVLLNALRLTADDQSANNDMTESPLLMRLKVSANNSAQLS